MASVLEMVTDIVSSHSSVTAMSILVSGFSIAPTL